MIVSTVIADSKILAESSTSAPKLVELLSLNSALDVAAVTYTQSTTEVMSSPVAVGATSYLLLEQLSTSYATLSIGVINNTLSSVLPYSKLLAVVEPFIPTQDYVEYGYFYEDYVVY